MEHVGPRKTSPGQGMGIGRSSGTSAEDRAALAGQRGERGKMDGAGEASGPARPGQGSRSVLDGLSPGVWSWGRRCLSPSGAKVAAWTGRDPQSPPSLADQPQVGSQWLGLSRARQG